MKLVWDDSKIELLKNLYPNSPWDIILKELKTDSRTAVQSKASKLKIKRVYKEEGFSDNFKNTKLSEYDKNFIIENYNNKK